MDDELPISSPLGLGDLLDGAFRLYRTRFWTLVLIAAVFLVPLGILSGAVTGQMPASSLDILRRLLTGSGPFLVEPYDLPTEPPSAGLMALGSLISILSFVIGGLVTLALTHQSIGALHGQKPSVIESIRGGLRRLLAFIGLRIAQGFVLGVLGAVFFLPFLCGLGSIGGGIGGGLLGVGAILVLGAVVVYLLARWIVAIPGMVGQRWGPTKSLSRSSALTLGQMWRVIGYLVLLAILGWVIRGVPGTLFKLAFVLLPLPDRLAVLLVNAFSMLTQALWQPLYVAALVLLYYDLRIRKETRDLAARVEELESETEEETDEDVEVETEVDIPQDDEGGPLSGDQPLAPHLDLERQD